MADQSSWRGAVSLRTAVGAAAVAIAYVGAAQLGFSLAFATKQVTAVWPPSGIATVALFLFGYRLWPGVLLGAFIANALHNGPLTTAAGIAVGNTLGPLLGAFLLRRVVKLDAALTRPVDVFGLLLFGAMIPMTLTATNGVVHLALGGIVPWSDSLTVWRTWWIGDCMGVLLFAPFLLTWSTDQPVPWRGVRLAEFVALFLTLFAASQLTLNGPWRYELEHAVFPFFIWAALRFGQRETATAVLMVVVVAIWGAAHEHGPFVDGTLDERLSLLEVFLAVASVAALTLGAVTADRSRAEEALRLTHDQLEARVRERTSEMVGINEELARKNEEVEAFVYIVSHDLRAPLVNLQAFSREMELGSQQLQEKLRAAALPAKDLQEIDAILKAGVSDPARYIQASTTKFQRLIDALLALSRSGREEYRQEVVDVQAVVNATLDSLRHIIQKREARVSVEPPLPKAMGDATAIGQVFANLIGNALSYLSPGRAGVIEIGGKAEDGMAHYWVKDNGSGIPATAQPRLFQVFQRFHPQLSPGEGMGLAFVKRMVERHGGKTWAESEEGAGTTFHVTLPVVRA